MMKRVAIQELIQSTWNKVLPINPDFEEEVEGSMSEEEKEEIFQLAAGALQTEYGKSIRMKKTPRVLTLEGIGCRVTKTI